MSVPHHYYTGLSKNNTTKQLRQINKSKKMYKKSTYHIREKLKSFKHKPSKHVVNFEKKYCVKITDLRSVEKVTHVPIKALKKIINKGMGAYYSSGSRPNQTPHSWGYARLASVLLKNKAYKIDKYIIDEFSKKIKPPNKSHCN
jgi:hypothetical protein